MKKEYEEIEPQFDDLDTLSEVDSNVLQWQLLQEAMVAREILDIFNSTRTKVLKNFDKIITEDYITKLYSEFEKKSKSIKRIEVEDVRMLDDLIVPIVPMRKKIPVEFKDWFEKTTEEDNEMFSSIVAPIDEEMKEIETILTKNQQKSAEVGGQQSYHELGILLAFVFANQRTLDWGRNYNTVLANKISQTLTNDIKFDILSGLQNKETLATIKAKLVKTFDKPIPVKVPAKMKDGKVVRKAYGYYLSPEQWAEITARTETVRWVANGKIQGYKQSGLVKEVIFTAIGDHKTCQECMLNDGTVYSLEAATGVIPLHCLGRCTWTPVKKKE